MTQPLLPWRQTAAAKPPMTEAEARQLAEEEGLQLVPATNNASGFRGVSRNGSSMSKPFRAEIWQGGEQHVLGTFTTVGEAALAVARFLGPAGSAAAAAAAAAAEVPKLTMTEAEARQLAEQEGLVLLPADNVTGFKGVSRNGSKSTLFMAQIRQDGKTHKLGTYVTAAEAALAYARHLGPAGCAAAAAPPSPAAQPPMTEEEARRLAAEEGLELLADDNGTGFKGVSHVGSSNTSKPFVAVGWRGGKQKSIGSFTSAAEAALAYARHVGQKGGAAAGAPAAPPEPPMTVAEARRQAAAAGLQLVASDNITGFKGVFPNGNGKSHSFITQVTRGGKHLTIGTFTSAAEAALAFARFLGPQGCAAATAPPAASEPPMTEEEARRLAAEEGLQLVTADNAVGFKGVSRNAAGW